MERRALLKAMGFGALLLPGMTAAMASAAAEDAKDGTDPSAGLYPIKRNPRYKLDRPLTDPKYSEYYNNFYEFGSEKDIADAAQALKIRPWTIKIDGMVEKPFEIGIDDLLKKMPLEERLYRHRCVEAWSMAVPWSGFPMAAFLALAKPLGSAKYVRMETFLDAGVASGQKQFWYPWPYVEGVTIAEAGNELAFMVTGMYGKPVPKQDGAPLRLALP
jgi:sulfoxide reductase catalytic subunit YedY